MKEERDKFWEYVLGDDVDFYNEFLADLSDEELDKFLEENPDFFKE